MSCCVAQRNGVELQALSAIEAHELEPRSRACWGALYSPTTSGVDPSLVMTALVADAGRLGIDIRTGLAWRERYRDGVFTSLPFTELMFGEIEKRLP